MSGGIPGGINFGLPRVDFSPLSQIGEAINQNNTRRAVQGIQAAPGSPGFLQQLGQTLLQQGDINGALTASRLLEASGDRAYQRQRDERDFAFRQTESARNQQNTERSLTRADENSRYDRIYRDESLNLQRQAANRREIPANFERDPINPDRVRPLPGGPEDPATIAARKAAEAASNAEKPLPAELGARVALSQSFLEGAPELRKQIEAGGVTGPIDRLRAEAGSGAPGEILRRIRSGSEAIVRNLTGAGMNIEEAKARVTQYEPAYTDSAETVLKKFNMLEEQLQRIEAEAYRGRGVPANRRGKNPFFEQQPAQAPAASPATPTGQQASPGRVDNFDAIPENRRYRDLRDGKVYRKINGQAVPE